MDTKRETQGSIHVPVEGNKLLSEILGIVNSNEELNTLWKIININAIDRLHMPDHGPVHFQIVANIALRISRLLTNSGVKLSISSFGLDSTYGELVIFLASVLHDLGMTISRDGHEEFSLIIANTLLRDLLSFLPTNERTIVTAETLHAIISHRSGGKPITLEGGIVRVADALDMSKGRSRIPYEAGVMDIHSVSAAAIDNVEITHGEEKPVQINIGMNNSAGLFQVDELLKKKIMGSGLEKYVKVKAYIERETEKKLIKEFVMKGL